MSSTNNFVKIGLTIHKISKFQPTDTTVKVNLELYFTLEKLLQIMTEVQPMNRGMFPIIVFIQHKQKFHIFQIRLKMI